MSDHKVIRIREWKANHDARMDGCRHETFVFMPDTRRVKCAQCYSDLDLFEVSLALAERITKFADEIDDLNTRLDDLC